MHEIAQFLVGTWLTAPLDGQGVPHYIRFTGDLRFLEPFGDPLKGSEPKDWTMRLWGDMEEEDLLRLRPRREHEGWTRRVHFENADHVIISNTETDPPQRWRCTRVAPAEIPEWFEERCARALEKPWL